MATPSPSRAWPGCWARGRWRCSRGGGGCRVESPADGSCGFPGRLGCFGFRPASLMGWPASLAVSPDNLTVRPDNFAVRPDNLTVRTDNLTVRTDNFAVSPDNFAVKPDNLAVSPDNLTVSPANFAVRPDIDAGRPAFFEKMPAFPHKTDVFARIHPFPEPLLLAMPWDSQTWDSGTWDSDTLSTPKPKRPMKRPTWYPRPIAEQIVRIQNIKTKLPGYVATLALVPAEATAAGLDCDNILYALDSYRGAIETFSKAAYARIEEALNGGPAGNIAWLGFTPGGAPGAVAYGCLQRLFTYIENKVKMAANYTKAIGLDLGLEPPATPAMPPGAVPDFSLRLTTGDKGEVVWHKGQSDGVRLQFNLGAAGMKEDTDNRPNYTLNWLPPAGQSVVIQVRLAFLLKNGTTGTWSDWKPFTLTGV